MAVFNDIEQYICTICREILLDPVTLPCNHTSCKDCLEQTLDNNKYQCFLCRKFIGSWYRNAKKRDLLINKELCNEIKKKFPDLIEKKLNGENISKPEFSLEYFSLIRVCLVFNILFAVIIFYENYCIL